MRRVLLPWIAALVLVIAAFGLSVVVLNATMYSASGFVASYLHALERKDAASALDLPGVLATDGTASDLLTDAALGDLGDIRLVHDSATSDGIHTVTYGYTAGGVESESTFTVRGTGAFLGLFRTWEFTTSPLATIAVTVLHDQRFRVNGVQLTSPSAAEESSGYLVFSPGVYVVDHESTYLTADPVSLTVNEPASVTAVQVNVQAGATFVTEVDKELRAFLDDCATQEVLQPTGCPFGKTFDNRVDSTPEWSIAEYPRVEIIPGSEVGSWLMPETDAAAHLIVDVQSLFDGSVSDYDKDVPFTVAYGITISTGDQLSIQAQND